MTLQPIFHFLALIANYLLESVNMHLIKFSAPQFNVLCSL